MSAPVITKLQTCSDPEQVKRELREIFFESSTKKDFKDVAEKEAFYHKYLGLYLERFPDLVFVARGDRVLGYIVGSPVTNDPELYQVQPHLRVFEPYFETYPAHLHINCHAESRGMGVGSKLLLELVRELQGAGITGLHCMTGATSQNRSFYKKLGFDFEVEHHFKGHGILFMGKTLSTG